MKNDKVFSTLRKATLATLCAGGLLYGTAACSQAGDGGTEGGGDTPADTGGEKGCGEKACGEKSCGEKSCGEKSCGEKSAPDAPDGEKSCGEKSCGEKTCGG